MLRRRAGGNARAHVVLCGNRLIFPRFGHQEGTEQGNDAADDDGQLRAEESGNDQLRQDKGQAGHQCDARDALERPDTAAARDDHQKRHQNHKRDHLEYRRKGQRQRIQPGHGLQGDGGDADGAERGRESVGDHADHAGFDRIHAHAGKHAGRYGDCRAEAGHALEKAAEAPPHQQDEKTLICGNAREHPLDDIHRAGF